MTKSSSTFNITLRPSKERGHADLGWLNSYFTFSFAEYFDPKHMGFRSLRVINDDTIEAGGGFGMHPHKDMEIISYVTEGKLEHKDSMGNGSIIEAGNVQKMSAGSGVTHSEFNPSSTSRAKLLQIWILPNKKDLKSSYQELNLKELKAKDGLVLIGANEDKPGLVRIFQDVFLYRGYLASKQAEEYALKKGRGVWIHLISGKIHIKETKLSAGDSASIEGEGLIPIEALEQAEFLLFDLN